jgi:hypothetical protein
MKKSTLVHRTKWPLITTLAESVKDIIAGPTVTDGTLADRLSWRWNCVGDSPDAFAHWRVSIKLLEERDHAIEVHRHAADRGAHIRDVFEGSVRAAACSAR